MKFHNKLSLMFCAFSLGVVATIAVPHSRPDPDLIVVVCEQGSFEAVEDPGDPYLREASDVCNLTNSEGRPVKVLVID